MITQLEKLVIALVGDGLSYQKMLQLAENQTMSFSSRIETIGKAITDSLTKPILALAAASTSEFGKFDLAMVESTAIMEDFTDTQNKMMKEQVFALSRMSPKSPQELARAYYHLASSGLNAKQSIAALPTVLKFAQAGVVNLEVATDLLTRTLNAFNLKSKDPEQNLANMTRMGDIIVKGANISQASVEEFGRAMARETGPIAQRFGFTVEEAAGALAVFADAGFKGHEGGNTFARMMRLLDRSTRKAALGLETFEIKVYDDIGNTRELSDVISDLGRELGKLSPEARGVAMEFMGMKDLQQKSLSVILNSGEKMKEYTDILRGTGSEMDRVANNQMKAFTNQLLRMWNTVRIVAIEIGEILAPYILELGTALQVVVDWWNSLSAEAKKTIVFGGLLVAILGPLILLLGLLGPALLVGFKFIIATFLAGKFVILGLAAVLGVLMRKVGDLKDDFSNFKEAAIAVWLRLKEAFFSFVTWATPIWVAFIGALKGALIAFLNIVEAVYDFFNGLVDEQTGRKIADDILFLLVNVFTYAEYILVNFGTIMRVEMNKVAYYWVQFANWVMHAFTVIERFGAWLSSSFLKAMGQVALNTILLFANMVAKVVKIVGNLPGLIAGTTDWSDVQWDWNRNMTNPFADFPDMEREMGENERRLAGMIEGQNESLDSSLAAIRERNAAAIDAILNPEIPDDGLGGVDWGKKQEKEAENTGRGIGDKFNTGMAKGMKEGKSNIDNVLFGSMDSLRRIAEFKDRMDMQEGLAQGSDVKVDSTLKDSQESARRQEKQINLLQDIRDGVRGGMRTSVQTAGIS